MFKEFKQFILRGNVIDLAVGVIIGGAFNQIVTSAVEDLFMPFLSIVTNRIKFENMFIALDGQNYDTLQAAQAAGVSTVNLGLFITAVINFILMAAIVFLIVKLVNRLHKKLFSDEPKPITTKTCPFCITSVHQDATRCPHCTAILQENIDVET